MTNYTFMEIKKLYGRMYNELVAEVTVLGGTVDAFIPKDKVVSVSVDSLLKTHLESIVTQITLKYEKEKKRLVLLDTFNGVRHILHE
jgi:hypothetical protein